MAALADSVGCATISGSDAHLPWEIGNAATALDLSELALDAVYDALKSGKMQALPQSFNGYPVYLGVGLMNRLCGRRYVGRGEGERVAQVHHFGEV